MIPYFCSDPFFPLSRSFPVCDPTHYAIISSGSIGGASEKTLRKLPQGKLWFIGLGYIPQRPENAEINCFLCAAYWKNLAYSIQSISINLFSIRNFLQKIISSSSGQQTSFQPKWSNCFPHTMLYFIYTYICTHIYIFYSYIQKKKPTQLSDQLLELYLFSLNSLFTGYFSI